MTLRMVHWGKVGAMLAASWVPMRGTFQRTLRWLPIVFCPRARWFRKSRDGTSFQTPRQSRARDHAVKCRQTWRPNFYNLFIENVAWIGSGFKRSVGWKTPAFHAWRKRKIYEACWSFNLWSWFHVICSIATIIERGKARWYITTHICSPWRCL